MSVGFVDLDTKNVGTLYNNDLRNLKNTAYKPAYKKHLKIIDEDVPSEVLNIISKWEILPEHIKQTIKTLVNSITADTPNDKWQNPLTHSNSVSTANWRTFCRTF